MLKPSVLADLKQVMLELMVSQGCSLCPLFLLKNLPELKRCG